MGGGINSVLNQARSALAAAQVGQNTTSKNVANVNTPGYSRQRVELQAGDPESYGRMRVGGGVEVASIARAGSDLLNTRIGEENTALGKVEGMADVYNSLELVFKDEGETGLTQAVSQFFNDLRTLSTQPDAMPLRAAVRESAESITARFQNVANSVDQVNKDLDRRLEGSISDVNALTEKIGSLNRQIMDVEARGKGVLANDERDARDSAIQDLSKFMEIQVTNIENGGVNISSGRLGPLVVGVDPVKLGAYRSEDGVRAGNVRIFMLNNVQNASPVDVTEKIDSGSLGGYLNVRDSVVPKLMDKVDGLAYNLAREVNSVHREAYGKEGRKGVDFFSEPTGMSGAASALSLSRDVKGNLANIATADGPNASGDNRAVLRMADLQQAPIFENGRANFSDLASSIVGSLGVEVKSAHDQLETQRGLVDQLSTFKTELSGVSLDEEAMNMMKFQKAFDASAKMIQVADQMMDTVINLKRL